jgi:hypothetical protein
VVVTAIVEPAGFFGKFWAQGMHCAAFDELAVSGVDESDGELSAKGHGARIEL